MNEFNNPGMFQLPQLFEQLIGTPQGEQLGTEFQLDDMYKKNKWWNSSQGFGLGQMNFGSLQPTQIKNDFGDNLANDFTETYYL